MKVVLTAVLPPAAAALLLSAALLLCSGCYTLRQGASLFALLGSARPLATLEAAGAPEDERLFAARVSRIRAFALNELGLADTRNYTGYVAIDRSYLAAVVSACAPDSFTRYQWRYPVVGTLPYKGFFNIADARRLADKLRQQGLDVWVRGVDAFSLLGFFREPLYSYMKDYPPHELADLLIHELTHATVFIRNQAQFNEGLAEFVGSEGSRLYMERTYGKESAEYQAMLASRADSDTYRRCVQELCAALEAVYTEAALSRQEKLERKAQVIAHYQAEYARRYHGLFQSETYQTFSSLAVNNAYLDLYRLYYDESDTFRTLYQQSGSSLPSFIAACKTLPSKTAAPQAALQAALQTP